MNVIFFLMVFIVVESNFWEFMKEKLFILVRVIFFIMRMKDINFIICMYIEFMCFLYLCGVIFCVVFID